MWKTRQVYVDLLTEFENLTLKRLADIGYPNYVEELTEPLSRLLESTRKSAADGHPVLVDMGSVLRKILQWYAEKGPGFVNTVPPHPPVSNSSRLLDIERLERVLRCKVLDDFTHLLCLMYRESRCNAGKNVKELAEFLMEHGQLDAVKGFWPANLIPEQKARKNTPVTATDSNVERKLLIDDDEEEELLVENKPRNGKKRKRNNRGGNQGNKQMTQVFAPKAPDPAPLKQQKAKQPTLQDRVKALEDRDESILKMEMTWAKEKETLTSEIEVLKKENKRKSRSIRALEDDQEVQQEMAEEMKRLKVENKKLKRRLQDTGMHMEKALKKLVKTED